MTRLKIEVDSGADGSRTVTLKGQLNYQSAPELQAVLKKLVEQRSRQIVVDLAEVPYIDSSVLAAFVQCLQGTKAYSGKLRLIGANSFVYELFRVTKLHTIFDIAPAEAVG